VTDLLTRESQDGAEWERAATSAVAAFVDRIARQPSHHLDVETERFLLEPRSESRDIGSLLSLISDAAAVAVETAGPRYFAYFPAGGLYSSVLGEYVAQAFNRYTGVSAMAPALVRIEQHLIHWFCRRFELPATATGLLTSGGSLATLSALQTARDAHLGSADPSAVIYVSQHTHMATAKAARILGFNRDQVHVVGADRGHRLDLDSLRTAIAADRQAGRRPFLAVGTAGTTSTGTVDQLADLATICRGDGLWMHVDAAYGGGFWLTERGRRLMDGMQLADSIVWDPHKSLFLPYGTGMLMVRDGELLRQSNTLEGDYLQDLDLAGGHPDFASCGPELTREYRALRLWLPLHLHGVAAFERALNERLDWTSWLHNELEAASSLITTAPDLTVITFRSDEGDDDTRRMLDSILATQRAFVSTTRVNHRLVIRVCVLSFRTQWDDVVDLRNLILDTAPRRAGDGR
jgi:aromatic-L-amino-acid decarboxylase